MTKQKDRLKAERQRFGKIVQKLRVYTTRMTQVALNEKFDLPDKTIERIENGNYVKINTELLGNLADEFNLTTLERKEFFLAAIAPDHGQLIDRDITDSLTILDKLITAMKGVCLPVFINDVYSDVIAVNNMTLELLNVKKALARATEGVDRFNLMRFLFEDDSIYKQLVGKSWQAAALQNVSYFRRMTLRYMAESYYDQIFGALQNYGSFKTFWEMVASREFAEGKDRSDVVIYEYDHPTLGHIKYVATDSQAVTRDGELYYVQYTPADDHTRKMFKKLKEETDAPCEVVRLAHWPRKN
ncbi:MAG: hypothetical protein GY833_18590 [Aestuariibacter sp.]|nr:hypothetical protein [Aestuariibacter sp.]